MMVTAILFYRILSILIKAISKRIGVASGISVEIFGESSREIFLQAKKANTIKMYFMIVWDKIVYTV